MVTKRYKLTQTIMFTSICLTDFKRRPYSEWFLAQMLIKNLVLLKNCQ